MGLKVCAITPSCVLLCLMLPDNHWFLIGAFGAFVLSVLAGNGVGSALLVFTVLRLPRL